LVVKRFVHAAFALGLLLAADPVAALADVKGPGEDTPLNLPSSSDSAQHLGTASAGGGSLARTFLGLAVVIGVIYGLYWVLRQVKKTREERSTGTGLHTEAVVPLGPNRALHLVRAGRELVLVGVAEQGVVPIRTYTEEEAIAVGLIGDEPERDTDASSGPTPGGRDGLLAFQAKVRQSLEGVRARTVRG
jgi:flagellar protein FliO/FliZ